MAVYFEKSPLMEVVFGIQMNSNVLNTADVMKLINHFHSEYPEIKETPLLPAVIENIDKPSVQKVPTEYRTRYHLTHKLQNKLIQIQPDRLLLNWRQVNNNIKYPRYENLSQEFFSIINGILIELDKGFTSKMNQYEMTYVAHIYPDKPNYSISDYISTVNIPDSIKDIRLNYSVPKPEIGGVFSVSIKSGINNLNNNKLLVIENTCRGFTSTESFNNWFEDAHGILIDEFMEMSTEEAKKLWGYKDV